MSIMRAITTPTMGQNEFHCPFHQWCTAEYHRSVVGRKKNPSTGQSADAKIPLNQFEKNQINTMAPRGAISANNAMKQGIPFSVEPWLEHTRPRSPSSASATVDRCADMFYNKIHMNNAPGDFELMVLMSVAKIGDGAYGVRIRKDVSAVRGREVSVGALYTTLQRLEDKKLVESWATDPLPIRGGRSRREYRVTGDGRRAIRDARRLASRLWQLDLGPQST
jgi:PadR family transcriptional regulator PadR